MQMNNIRTWRQGFFVDHRRYSKRSQEWKDQMDQQEKLLVRPGPTDNAICQCNNPEDAEWIASRLNLASILEQKVYGKTANVELGVKSMKAFHSSDYEWK